MQKYVCDVCGYEYDPAEGDPQAGVAPGTAFADLPEDWVCPVCRKPLDDGAKTRACPSGHCFDRSAQGGYVNLLRTNRRRSGQFRNMRGSPATGSGEVRGRGGESRRAFCSRA